MRRKIIRKIDILLVLVFCASMLAISAAARSSDYIYSEYASAVSAGGGKITINFKITGTGSMSEIGATKIEIKNSTGTTLKTYRSTDAGYGYMMGTNRSYYSSSVTYQGVTGNSYYAVVYFRAGNSSGSDTATYTTLLETA